MFDFKKWSRAELKAFVQQASAEDQARETGPADTHKWWGCGGNKGQVFDLGELTDLAWEVGAVPLLQYTDKGVYIGVGPGKGFGPGGFGPGECFPKGLPLDRLERFMANKGFNPFRPYPPYRD